MRPSVPPPIEQLRWLLAHGYGKQDALAAAFGVHKSTVSRWLSGDIHKMRKSHREKLDELCAPFRDQPRWLRAEAEQTIAELGGGDACNDDP